MNFQNLIDWYPQMLDELPIPPEIDEETLQSAIVFECGLLTPLYSEPATMRAAILQWFGERQWTFEHLVNIIKSKYSPIENTDRYETMSETVEGDISRSETDTRNLSQGSVRNLSQGDSRSRQEATAQGGLKAAQASGTVSRDTEGKVSAFNASTYSPSTDTIASESNLTSESESYQSSESLSSLESMHASESESASSTHSETSTISHKTDDDRSTRLERHVHGNIGVSTNQTLIQEELALLQGFNIYSWIAINLRHSLFLEVW